MVLLLRVVWTLAIVEQCIGGWFWSKTACEREGEKGITRKTMIKEHVRHVCYFIVDGASDQSSTWTSNMIWNQYKTFNVAVAREICKKYHATLPILRNKLEGNHVMENYELPAVENIALDLLLSPDSSEYMWSDGTRLDNSIPNQHVQVMADKNYSYTIMRKEKSRIIWYDYPADEQLWNGLVVVCRQESENKTLHFVEKIMFAALIPIVITIAVMIVVLEWRMWFCFVSNA